MLGNMVLQFPNTLSQNECSGIHYFLLGKHLNPESLLIPLFPLSVAKKVGHSYPEPSQAPRVLLRPTPPNVSRAEAHARCPWIWRHLFQGHTGPSRIRACTNNSRGNPFIRPLVESINRPEMRAQSTPPVISVATFLHTLLFNQASEYQGEVKYIWDIIWDAL